MFFQSQNMNLSDLNQTRSKQKLLRELMCSWIRIKKEAVVKKKQGAEVPCEGGME